jgi:hypothetical protein
MNGQPKTISSLQAETWRISMIKILAAIGFGSALMLAPALALADDAAPAAAAPAKPMHKAKHHTTKHHTTKHHASKKAPAPAAPAADAPKS